jgi:hypothetical protein
MFFAEVDIYFLFVLDILFLFWYFDFDKKELVDFVEIEAVMWKIY